MISNNNNNNSSSSTNSDININRLSQSTDCLHQSSYVHFQPFRVSYSIINLKEQFLHSIRSKHNANTYQRFNFVKDSNYNRLSTRKFTENYHLFESKLIKKFFDSNQNVLSKEVLEKMWKSSQFCDLLLIVQGSEYLAHRLVLAMSSQKFKKIFHKHKNDFVTRVHLHHSTHKSLQLILNYLYTNDIVLTIYSIDDILTCAKELDIRKLADLCITYLSRINKRTIFQILDIACKHNLSEVYRLAHKYLIQSIDECIQTKEFIDIAYWMLNQILSDVTIEKRQESLVFDRTLQWLSCNRVSNEDLIFELLNKIRWENLSYISLKEILAINYEILHNPIVEQWLIKKLNDKVNNQVESRREKDRSSQPKAIVCQFFADQTITKSSRGSLSHPFENEQLISTNWVSFMNRSLLTTFKQNKSQSIPPILEQRVYFGYGKPIRAIEYYDPKPNVWKLAKHLRSGRLGCAVVSFDNKLFPVGGYDDIKST
ncbi:unnamed protein product [Rotaria socialis]|uniref:BTB domain-containing protein n=1 Tax=Rotaria socialis TaxID=392032 RepID=A0A820EIT3_9BILA|nr:unnamed protein product [Rotaria socialis]